MFSWVFSACSSCLNHLNDLYRSASSDTFLCVDDFFFRCRPPASRRPQLISLKKGWFLSSSQSLFLNPRRFAGFFSIRPSHKSLHCLLNFGVYEAGSFKILRATSLFSTWRRETFSMYQQMNWGYSLPMNVTWCTHVQYLLASYSKGPFGGDHLIQGDSQSKIVHCVVILLLLQQLWSHETYIHRRHCFN